MRLKVFLSYEREDAGTVDVFREHIGEEDIDVEFQYYDTRGPFESADAPDTQAAIKDILQDAKVTLVMIGRTT